MKILHVTDTSILNYDGISTYVNELVEEGKEKGDEILVFTTSPASDKIRNKGSYEGIIKEFPCFRVPGKPKFIIIFPWGMKKAIREFNPDVVWVHTVGTLGMKAAALVIGKYKLVFTKHCFDGLMWNTYLKIPLKFHGFLNFWAQKFENKILQAANIIFFHITDISKVKDSKYFNKFILLPPPLGAAFFENKVVKPVTPGKLTFGFCGRCDPDKGIEDSYKGLEIFHRQHPEIKLEFILIGDGDEAHRLKAKYTFIKTTITGFINDVIPYYDMLDAYLLASKHEMISLSSLEAYARRKLLFSVPIGYLVEKAGSLEGMYLFENPAQLAERLNEVFVNRDKNIEIKPGNIGSILLSYPELYNRVIRQEINSY